MRKWLVVVIVVVFMMLATAAATFGALPKPVDPGLVIPGEALETILEKTCGLDLPPQVWIHVRCNP